MNTHEIAWAAGIIDGEGCIMIVNNPYHHVEVIVGMTHKPTIENLVKLFGGNVHKRKKYSIIHKQAWIWKLQGPKAVLFLEKILKYTITKKEEIKLAILFPFNKGRLKTKIIKERELLKYKLQQLKRKEWKQ